MSEFEPEFTEVREYVFKLIEEFKANNCVLLSWEICRDFRGVLCITYKIISDPTDRDHWVNLDRIKHDLLDTLPENSFPKIRMAFCSTDRSVVLTCETPDFTGFPYMEADILNELFKDPALRDVSVYPGGTYDSLNRRNCDVFIRKHLDEEQMTTTPLKDLREKVASEYAKVSKRFTSPIRTICRSGKDYHDIAILYQTAFGWELSLPKDNQGYFQ